MKINKQKFLETIKEDWQDLKQNFWKRTIQAIWEATKIFIIVTTILYFITRPYECKVTTTNETIHFEQIKFYEANKIPLQCHYNIDKDAKNMIYALKNKPIINTTTQGGQEQTWQKLTLPKNQ